MVQVKHASLDFGRETRALLDDAPIAEVVLVLPRVIIRVVPSPAHQVLPRHAAAVALRTPPLQQAFDGPHSVPVVVASAGRLAIVATAPCVRAAEEVGRAQRGERLRAARSLCSLLLGAASVSLAASVWTVPAGARSAPSRAPIGRLLPLRLCPLHGAGLGDGGRSRGLGDEALHGRVAGEPSGTRRAGRRRGRHVGVVCVCWCAKAVACGLEALLCCCCRLMLPRRRVGREDPKKPR